MWAAGEGHLHICKYVVEECGVDVHLLEVSCVLNYHCYSLRCRDLYFLIIQGKLGMKRHALV